MTSDGSPVSHRTTALLHDGSTIPVEVTGTGPAVLLPVDPVPATGAQADELRTWGVDPALGRTLVDALSPTFRVVAADYEGHRMAHPAPGSLTPENVAADLLAIADATGAATFAYYGYSWLALSGLQLALRTDRLTALAMGGFPPLDGPYAGMLAVTRATHALTTASPAATTAPAASPTAQREASDAVGQEERARETDVAPGAGGDAATGPEDFDWEAFDMTLGEDQTRQFVTLYEALEGFDDRAASAGVTCPRLAFAGSADEIDYGERWGGVHVSIGGALAAHADGLRAVGWDVRLLDGLDHTRAMQPGAVLPVLGPWLASVLTGE
ncbi:alpha/beta hydrolase [Oerskovia sp. NPDC057915]|uniref:alpha/beta hydrolase n=1 Tax=Oerskovia sp. NPDC057915 TaxID=3346280 RepID=UPI0036DA0FB7